MYPMMMVMMMMMMTVLLLLLLLILNSDQLLACKSFHFKKVLENAPVTF